MKKQIHDMTEKEILRRQLELLAEDSEKAYADELGKLSNAMVDIYKLINRPAVNAALLKCFFVMNTYFVVCFLVYVKKLFWGKT